MSGAAIFDLDRTLLQGGTGPLLSRAMYDLGVVTRKLPGEKLLYGMFDLIGETLPSIFLARQATLVAKGREMATFDEAAVAAALAAQPSLHDQALSQRVVLVGPGSLMALLRTVAFTWQQDALSSSARELLDLGRDLHRRLATLGTHTAKVGRSLQSSVEAYNAMVGALESRVMVTARRMNDLDLVDDEHRPSCPLRWN